jgi:oligoribonuclease NrnB/cAMP/cGMP phosphodiesterase (DHH superfamily)
MPMLVKYVEDNDLWRKRYGAKSKGVSHYLYLFSNQPSEMLKFFDVPIEQVEAQGAIISRYVDFIVEQDVKTTEPLNVRIGEHITPFYNIDTLKSESGNQLAIERNQTVGLFSIDGYEVHISFRCLDAHTPSALDLAKALGGGGHRNASGAGIPLDVFFSIIVKKDQQN